MPDRPGCWNTGRWCRRQPLTAGLSAGRLILALASGAVIVQQWWQAMTLVREERAARQQAEDNFAIARQLVSELAQVGTTPLTAEFDAQREQQRQALLKAESYCRRLLQDPQASAEVRMTLAQVYEGLSGLYRSLGDLQEAEQASIRAVAEWQRLVDEDDNPTSARGLTRARRLLALQYANQGNLLLALTRCARRRPTCRVASLPTSSCRWRSAISSSIWRVAWRRPVSVSKRRPCSRRTMLF